MHVVACRDCGIALLGPEPARIFPAMPMAIEFSAIERELDWAITHEPPPEYTVLTACRAWWYASEGKIGSKVEAGDWARLMLGEEPTLTAALKRQLGAQAELTKASATEFAERLRSLLHQQGSNRGV